MYCRNCGKELLEGAKFCQYCSSIQEDNQNQVAMIQSKINDKQEVIAEPPVDNHSANLLCTISLILYFGGPIITFMLYLVLAVGYSATDSLGIFGNILRLMTLLSSMSGLAAYVLMIIARVKYPKSKYAKVVMWIYIVLFVLGIIAFAALIIYCGWYTGNCLHQLGEIG